MRWRNNALLNFELSSQTQEEKMKHASILGICLGYLLASITVANAESYRVCIGEIEHNCPASHNLFSGCGSNPHAVAKETCTVWEDGKPVGSGKYRIKHDDSKSGGHCGYEFYTISCAD